MYIGDRVLVEAGLGIVNCAGIPFAGLTGTVIAKARNTNPTLDLWLVLFDRDICGLNIPEDCDHDFARQERADARAYHTVVEGAVAEGRRNQRFFFSILLKLISEDQEPRNNDGRTFCFWCGAPTKRVPGIATNNYDICTGCGK